jgi:hypothetical protein
MKLLQLENNDIIMEIFEKTFDFYIVHEENRLYFCWNHGESDWIPIRVILEPEHYILGKFNKLSTLNKEHYKKIIKDNNWNVPLEKTLIITTEK